MRLSGRMALATVVVVTTLAGTLFVLGPATGDETLFSGPTHPVEPGGKGKKGQRAPEVVRA